MEASSILVISTRRIGDVLLTTPLVRTLRQAYPSAQLDILVFTNTAGVLEGNPDLDTIIKVPERPNKKEYFSIIKKLFRKYDLTVSVQGGDRPMIYSFFAGNKKRIAILHSDRRQEKWKQWLLDDWILLDNVDTHTVIQNLKLADNLSLKKHYKVVLPKPEQIAYKNFISTLPFSIEKESFVLLHPFPMFRYKDWHFDGWVEVIRYLLSIDKKIILSGGPGHEEFEYCQSLVAEAGSENVISTAGTTSLAILSELMIQAEAYVGPDTAVTHIAAATGIKTIVLLGPSNPMKWGAWPVDCALNEGSPWIKKQDRQESGNVVLLQGTGDCVPCFEEGCDRHIESLSLCLQNLPAQRVIEELKFL